MEWLSWFFCLQHLLPFRHEKRKKAIFKGKAALVTGGAQEIGKTICQEFLARGAKVCVADVDVAKGQKTLEELQKQYGVENVVFQICDDTNEINFEAALLEAKATFGHLDILVNTCEICRNVASDINLQRVSMSTNVAKKHLANKKGTKNGTMIINTSCDDDRIRPSEDDPISEPVFKAWEAKWGIENESTRVKVNGVCPHEVDIEIIKKVLNPQINPAGFKIWQKQVVAKRIRARLIADAYVQLVKNNCSKKLLHVSFEKGILPKTYHYN